MTSTPSRRYGMLSEVARAAGVSQSTVSKVVHGRRDVGEETRAKVLALLDEEGYTPPSARTTADHVFAVFRDLDSPYTHALARSIVRAGTAAGLQTVVGTTERQSVSHWLDAASQRGSLGLVLAISLVSDSDQARVRERHIPLVLIDPLADPLVGIPCLAVTNWQGGHDAVRHLLDLGHTRIGAVAGRPHSPAGAARLHGYRAALLEAGIEADPALIRATDFDYEDAIPAALALLRAPDRPTAIFATSDAQALGALEAARRLRIGVPEELSVVSFDDTPAAATSSPPLTAVRQPFDDLAQSALRVLGDLTSGAPVADRVELATTLVPRASTRAPALAAASVV